jgi:Tat protein translocase TatC
MKKKRSPRAEMPFLDHLEELRWRIIWSVVALLAGTVAGFFIVQQYDVLGLLKRPIAELLPAGKLFVTRPTDAFIITLKLAVVVGAILAAPVVAWQAWIFLAPALYEHEKRFVVPTLLAGLVLFLIGALVAYLWVLPAALRILFSFQRADLEFIITANEYFNFAALFILAFGLVFELPLVMALLMAFGLVSPSAFSRNRPIALVVAAIGAALLTPPDALSMLMMLIPVMALYELGIVVGRLVWRGRRAERATKAAMLVLLLSVLGAGEARSQERPRAQVTDTLRADTTRLRALDTAVARKLGLPTTPSRNFPPVDSVMQALMKEEGFRITRYAADSLTLFAPEEQIELTGSVLVEREGSTLEADTVRFFQAECRLLATGKPTLFDRSTVLQGENMAYNTCEHRGIVAEAFTAFNQSGVDWFLRGALAVDSASTRIYARGSEITSCDLPAPHYHFGAGSVKWVSNTIMVARPAVLYVRDIPVLWLPFIFQDMRQGRRSGLLVPRFGINDIVRPNRGYQRHVNNVGFYLALNDYLDFQTSLDWWSGTMVQLNGGLQYRWLDRFLDGSLALSRIWEFGDRGSAGRRSVRIGWRHNQSFDMRTRLSADIDYVSSVSVLERNTVDPRLATANLRSTVNFNKQLRWGSFNLGGTRTQDLSNGVVTMTLPSLSLTPRPINLGQSVTWSPGFSIGNTQTLNQPAGVLPIPPREGQSAVESLLVDSRNTQIQLNSPIRIGSWNWPNSFTISDSWSNRRTTVRLIDPSAPGDTLTRFYAEDFSTGIDWNTSIGLPILFPATWRLAPSVGIQNSTAGPFLLRNRFTGGDLVAQGKRLSFGATLSPTLFGFFPGFGPLLRIRHAVSPSVSWQYAPSASVPERYARALDPTGTRPLRQSPAMHSVTVALSQTFEAKLRPPPDDTLGQQNARKIKLLSIQTSGISYNFEQDKEPGKTGWVTGSVSNTFTSELLPGFSLSTTHELWEGAVGSDTARFSPFLSQVSMRFGLSGRTLSRLIGLLQGEATPHLETEPRAEGPTPGPRLPQRTMGGLTSYRTADELTAAPRGRGLEMSLSFDDQRVRRAREAGDGVHPSAAGNRTLGFQIGFSPARNWVASWSTVYNFITKEFGEHLLRLERDLHRWRATFSFVKSPNGNFAFNFYISLLDQPDIKFQYDQRTIAR